MHEHNFSQTNHILLYILGSHLETFCTNPDVINIFLCYHITSIFHCIYVSHAIFTFMTSQGIGMLTNQMYGFTLYFKLIIPGIPKTSHEPSGTFIEALLSSKLSIKIDM